MNRHERRLRKKLGTRGSGWFNTLEEASAFAKNDASGRARVMTHHSVACAGASSACSCQPVYQVVRFSQKVVDAVDAAVDRLGPSVVDHSMHVYEGDERVYVGDK